MAVARDTSGQATSTGTTTTLGLTLGASATLLLAAALIREGTDRVTGVTWNGEAMTELPTNSPATFTRLGSTFTIHLYYTLSPATGTHDLVATASSNPGGNDLDLYGVSYTGPSTSAFPDNSTKVDNDATSPLTTTLTPVGAGAWTFMFGSNEADALAASTGSTLIQNQHGSGIFDSNGIVAGSYSMNATYGGSSGSAGIMVSFAPDAVAPANNNNLLTLGVG